MDAGLPEWTVLTLESGPYGSMELLPSELPSKLLLAAHPSQRTHSAAHHVLHHPALAHLLEHLAHLRILPKELVHILHSSSRAGSDPLPSRTGDDIRVQA